MKRLVLVALVLSSLTLGINSCKKEKTPDISFSTTNVLLNQNETATITVQVSSAVNKIIDVYLESIGTDTIWFGSVNDHFLNEDSLRLVGALSSSAVISQPITGNVAHLTLGFGTTSFTITLKAYGDNFAKKAVEYKIRIKSATNANVKSGSDVCTINVPGNDMAAQFVGTFPNPDYALGSYSFSKNAGDANYTFNIPVTHTDGSPLLTANFTNVQPITGVQYDTSADQGYILKLNFQPSTAPNAVRGNYWVSTGDSLFVNNATRDLIGFVNCTFVKF